MGSDLTVTTTREHMIISANCLRDKMYDCLELLKSVALEPAYKSWEVRDNLNAPSKLDVAKYHTEPATMVRCFVNWYLFYFYVSYITLILISIHKNPPCDESVHLICEIITMIVFSSLNTFHRNVKRCEKVY